MAEICVVMPALNEADALPVALADRPANVRVIVVDNGSTDQTAQIAFDLGADVVIEPQCGFGAACKAGLDAAYGADIVVYMDADATCKWSDLEKVTAPIVSGEADFVLGRRVPQLRETGSMPLHVAIANSILGRVCGRLAGVQIHDIPPYRAIRRDALESLDIQDRTYGWPLEMVLRAGRSNLRVTEVPVAYCRRVGTSKVTGTLSGTVKATTRMLSVLWKQRRA